MCDVDRGAVGTVRRSRNGAAGVGLALVGALALGGGAADAQLRPSHEHGEHVSPAFEGWVENADGSMDVLFGYMNRNWEEVVHVPVGPSNRFIGGEEDRGQPTEFLPRRNRFVFSVRVPVGFTEDDEIVWELTSKGETQRAYASIKPDFRLDNVAIMSETGALGPGTSDAETRANQPPAVVLEGGTERTVRVGEPVTLVATVTDDGVPDQERSVLGPDPDATPQQLLARAMNRPIELTVDKSVSLHMTWFPYRGSGAMTFDPPQVKPWEDTRPFQNSPWSPFWVAPEIPEDGRWVTEVTFRDPGTYVLSGRADDGGLFMDVEVTVHVRPLVP